MRVSQKSATALVVSVFTAALANVPGTAGAADITWHSKGQAAKWSWVGNQRSYERTHAVEFRTGEKATSVCNGMNHSVSGAGNKLPWDQHCVMRFDDLSAIVFHANGAFDPSTSETRGTGKFIGGTGRFEGISGDVTWVGHFSGDTVETDVVATYSLPADSAGFQVQP